MSDTQLRIWAREQFPYLVGMSHSRVCSHRRKWIAAVRKLGKNWIVLQRQAKPRKVARPLRVVGA